MSKLHKCFCISVTITKFRVYGFRNYAYVDLHDPYAQEKKVLLITEERESNTRNKGRDALRRMRKGGFENETRN
jgi:hypothetical protein